MQEQEQEQVHPAVDSTWVAHQRSKGESRRASSGDRPGSEDSAVGVLTVLVINKTSFTSGLQHNLRKCSHTLGMLRHCPYCRRARVRLDPPARRTAETQHSRDGATHTVEQRLRLCINRVPQTCAAAFLFRN